MKRIHSLLETEDIHFLLPTKSLKLSLKAHPQETLKMARDDNIVMVNSGQKLLLFGMEHGFNQGDSGLQGCLTNLELLSLC